MELELYYHAINKSSCFHLFVMHTQSMIYRVINSYHKRPQISTKRKVAAIKRQ